MNRLFGDLSTPSKSAQQHRFMEAAAHNPTVTERPAFRALEQTRSRSQNIQLNKAQRKSAKRAASIVHAFRDGFGLRRGS